MNDEPKGNPPGQASAAPGGNPTDAAASTPPASVNAPAPGTAGARTGAAGTQETSPAGGSRLSSLWRLLGLRKAEKESPQHPKVDSSREIAETIVFVVVLVLMLKAFVAEAFIIPTGSMATTLLGYHRHATCDKCGCKFPVNASDEAEPNQDWRGGPISFAICPNCRNIQGLAGSTSIEGGDKVLVLKPEYDVSNPERLDVIVFKYPRGPQENFSAKNYIKRLWGLPGERLSIFYGDVYLRQDEKGQDLEGREQLVETSHIIRKPATKIMEMRRLVNDNDLQPSDLAGIIPPWWYPVAAEGGWTPGPDNKTFSLNTSEKTSKLAYRNLHRPPPLSKERFERLSNQMRGLSGLVGGAGGAAGPRLPVQLQSALQQVDHTLGEVAALHQQCKPPQLEVYQRQLEGLQPNLNLSEEARRVLGDAADGVQADLSMLRSELSALALEMQAAREVSARPHLITDFLAYNTGLHANGEGEFHYPYEIQNYYLPNWVRDIMLECEVSIASTTGKLTLEINAGIDTHHATFDLSNGQCTLSVTRYLEGDPGGKVIASATAQTRLKGAGRHRLRFANFDHRLTLWVDGSLPFQTATGDGLDFEGPPFSLSGPRATDLQPVSIMATQAELKVSHLKIWRDIYYTRDANTRDRSDYRPFGVDRSAVGISRFFSLSDKELAEVNGRQPVAKWQPFYEIEPAHYPQPGGKLGDGEFFALGDNSTRSSDSRDWGPVPQRLLLGKAVFVYWPITRFGLIW